MKQPILIVCLLAGSAIASENAHEAIFPAAIFGRGTTISVKVENQGKRARNVTVQRYSADGKVLDTVSRRAEGGSSLEVRLAAAPEKPEFGWVRVLDDGRGAASVRVSLTTEHSSGAELDAVTNVPVPRWPLSDAAVRRLRRYSINQKYTLDVSETHCVAFFFVNLSDYPIRLGHCQAVMPGCSVTTLPDTVLPLEQKMIQVDRAQRYFELDSTPGYSAGMGLQLQQVSSAIKFSPEDGNAPAATPLGAEGICSACDMGRLRANSEAAKSSPAAAAGSVTNDHVSTPEALARLVETGQGSKCAVITVPPGAEVSIDGNVAGVTPLVFVLQRHGDVPRTLTIKLAGYKTIVRKVIPDGGTLPIGLEMEKE